MYDVGRMNAHTWRPQGSAAMMRMPGFKADAATAIPLIMPPPLTGTMMASSSGTCSSTELMGMLRTYTGHNTVHCTTTCGND